MEEDDEMHSPVSAGSGSPASPRANGRITVTVAVPSQIPAAAQESPQNNTLTLALASQVRSSGGREDCWSESATAVLIEAWGERYLELSRGNLKQKHWKEVADIVSSREDYGKTPKTDIQCKNRIDTVKKKYKLEKSKMVAGGGPSKWPFFDKLDHLIGATAKGTPGSASGGGSVPPGFLAKNHKIPMGMPVGVRGGGVGHFVPKHQQQLQQLQKANAKKRDPVEWDSDSSREVSPVSADSFPPPVSELKRPRMAGRGANTGLGRGRGGGGGVGKEIRGRDGGGEKKGGWGNSMRELTQAMLRFGEAYEHAETAKLQQVVEMEKQRMKFAKELELQRMQFFMKTQLEISQLKHGRRNGNASNHHRSSNTNNSDSN
ncbi:trihelix transcription factor ASIL2 [Rosa sericea]